MIEESKTKHYHQSYPHSISGMYGQLNGYQCFKEHFFLITNYKV